MNLKLKICGLKFLDNIREVIKYRPDYLGFIFYPGSPRYAGENMEELSTLNIPSSILKTGVFVDENMDKVIQIASSISLDMVQLHGKEPVEDCIELKESGLKVVKVFSVGEDFDFNQMEPYSSHVDHFLFDTKGQYHGGNSIPFDWEIFENYPFTIPFFLGGGVGPENIDLVRQITNPYLYALDVNSRLEAGPGFKDTGKLELFRRKFDKL